MFRVLRSPFSATFFRGGLGLLGFVAIAWALQQNVRSPGFLRAQLCGDAVCDEQENLTSCAADCAVCNDGVDNDYDRSPDYPLDPGCSSPQDNNESDGKAECEDRMDNDGDGVTDMDDSDCLTSADQKERCTDIKAHWTDVGDLPVSAYEHTSLVYDGKMWVIGGSGDGGGRKVFFSSDGSTWTEAGSNALPISLKRHSSVVFNNKMWVIGGMTDGNLLSRKVFSSTDGVTWTEAGTNALPMGLQKHTSVIFNEQMWVIGGNAKPYEDVNHRKVFHSFDGITWTEAGTDALPNGLAYHQSAVFHNLIWVIGNRYDTVVYWSRDGWHWYDRGSLYFGGNDDGHTVSVFSGLLWSLAGEKYRGGSSGYDAVSLDGSAWQNVLPDRSVGMTIGSTSFEFNGKLWLIGGKFRNGQFNRKVTSATLVPQCQQCSDHMDNDGDGQKDYPLDSGCTNMEDDSEQACGNGVQENSESCDDGDTASGDGCSATCTVETGWTCTETAPSTCTRTVISSSSSSSSPSSSSTPSSDNNYLTTLDVMPYMGGTDNQTQFFRVLVTARNNSDTDDSVQSTVVTSPATILNLDNTGIWKTNADCSKQYADYATQYHCDYLDSGSHWILLHPGETHTFQYVFSMNTPAPFTLTATTGPVNGSQGQSQQWSWQGAASSSSSSSSAPADSGTMIWTAIGDMKFGLDPIYAVTYGLSKFVAVGYNGKGSYSTDGVNWTAVSMAVGTTPLNSVTYGNGKYVAVGQSGKGAYSTDGITWTAISPTILSSHLYSVTYGNGKFVAVGAAGGMYSTNGTQWTRISDGRFNAPFTYKSVTYGNGKFVAVGNTAAAIYSSDGISWTSISDTKFGSTNMTSVTYGPGRFVVAGYNGKGSYSNDGATWTAVDGMRMDADLNFYASAYGNSMFVAAGVNGSFSKDGGITWTPISDMKLGFDAINSIAYGNGKFVAVSQSGKGSYSVVSGYSLTILPPASVAYRQDAEFTMTIRNLTLQTSPPLIVELLISNGSSYSSPDCDIYSDGYSGWCGGANNYFVLAPGASVSFPVHVSGSCGTRILSGTLRGLASNPIPVQPTVQASTIDVPCPSSSSSSSFAAPPGANVSVTGPAKLVMGQTDEYSIKVRNLGTTPFTPVLYVSWSPTSFSYISSSDPSCQWGGGSVVACTPSEKLMTLLQEQTYTFSMKTATDLHPSVCSSSIETLSVWLYYDHYDVNASRAEHASLSVPVSCEVTPSDDIMVWNMVTDMKIGGSFKHIKSIAYGAGKFVAVGDNGEGAYSTDGVTWTKVPDMKFGTDGITDIAFGNGKFVAVGASGKAAYSTDGITWVALPSTATKIGFIIHSITFGDGKFVMVSNGLQSSYSLDGITWTKVNLGTSEDITAVAYGNGKFVAASNAGRGRYSTDGITWTAIVDMKFGSIGVSDIVYGGGKFLAVGGNNKGAYSTDGITWTAMPDIQFTGGYMLSSVAYGNGKFVAVGGSGKGAYSLDGITWTAIPDMKFGYDGINAVAYSNGRFVAVGVNGRGSYSGLFAAADSSSSALCSVTILPANQTPSWMTSADFNADGHPDLAALDVSVGSGGRHLSIFINNGDGTFLPKVDYTPGDIYEGIAAGDFDNDGYPDIVLSHIGGTGKVLSLLRNDGSGKFSASPQYATLTHIALPDQIAVGDINGDGDLDLFVGGLADGTEILYGASGMNFSAGPQLATLVGNSLNPTLVDVNADGWLDAVSTPAGAGHKMVVYLNDQKGHFDTGTSYEISGNPYTSNLYSGDVNHDGYIDLLQATNYDGQIIIWLNNGNGTFREGSRLNPDGIRDGALTDFNGDGKLDLFVGNYTQEFVLYRGNGDGTFASPVGVALPKVGRKVVTEDFDGDGYPDFAMALAENDDGVLILLNKDSCLLGKSADSVPHFSSSSSRRSFSSSFNSSVSSIIIIDTISSSSRSSSSSSAQPAVCGNFTLEDGEECEVGQCCASGFSCDTRTCFCTPLAEVPTQNSTCGNYRIEVGEDCEDGISPLQLPCAGTAVCDVTTCHCPAGTARCPRWRSTP